MSPGEIMQVLAAIQAASAGSQYTAQAAQAGLQGAQDVMSAEHAKAMEEENSGGGFKSMLPTIAGIAGSFIPGVGIVAGPALAAATAAATGQDPLMAGAGALGGGLMGAATKGITGAAGAAAQGAAQTTADTVAQAGMELGSTAAANNLGQLGGQLGVRGLQDAGTNLVSQYGSNMAGQLGTKAATGAATGAVQGAAQTAGQGLGGLGAQLSLQGAQQPTQQGIMQLLNQSARDNALQQLQNLPAYTAQGLASNMLGAVGQGIYNRNAPMAYQGGGYGLATGAPGAGGGYIQAGPYGTNPLVYDPATQGPNASLARMSQENIPYKDQFMMSLGQGLMGLSNQYALDSQNKVEIPERPFGLNQATAASIEAPYREAAAERQKQAREDARFNQEMGLKKAEFGETVRSNKVTETNQGERTRLEGERLELEKGRAESEQKSREINDRLLERQLENMESPEEAKKYREMDMQIKRMQAGTAAQNAQTAANRAQLERETAEFERSMRPYIEAKYKADATRADYDLEMAQRRAMRYQGSDFRTFFIDNMEQFRTRDSAVIAIMGAVQAGILPPADGKVFIENMPVSMDEQIANQLRAGQAGLNNGIIDAADSMGLNLDPQGIQNIIDTLRGRQITTEPE